MEAGVAPFTIILIGEFVFLVYRSGLCRLEALFPKGETFPLADLEDVSLNYKPHLLCGYFRLLTPRTLSGEERSHLPGRDKRSDHKGMHGCCYTVGARRNGWYPGNPIGHLLVFLCPILIVKGQVQQP